MKPIGAFTFLGTLDALFIIIIYILVNIACIRFFWRKCRERFSWLRHGLFPLLSTLIMGGIFVAALAFPGPGPLASIPYVVAAWIGLGLAALLSMRGKLA